MALLLEQQRRVAADDAAAARRTLRDQIARLDGELADLGRPYRAVTRSGRGARLVSIAELERTRDALAAAASDERRRLDELGRVQEEMRRVREELLLDPSRHRFARVSNDQIGEPGCRDWHVRPRFGLIGMLAGWWRVVISSGCPLAAAPGGRDSRHPLRPLPRTPGMESVWDYPRPPRVEPCTRRVRIVLGGETIADSTAALRVLETSHPPGIYVPQDDFAPGALTPATARRTMCEWKGLAAYLDVRGGAGRIERAAAWTYPDPVAEYAALARHVSVYPGRMDACYIGDERVQAQEGNFYGGWITGEVTGPFKGAPGTFGW